MGRAQPQDAAVAGGHAHAAARVAAERKVRAAVRDRHLARDGQACLRQKGRTNLSMSEVQEEHPWCS